MSDRSQDKDYSKTFVAEDLTTVMNVAGVGGRSFAKLVNETNVKNPASVSIKSVKCSSKQTPVLSPVCQVNTAEEMMILLTSLIGKRFTLSNSVTKN